MAFLIPVAIAAVGAISQYQKGQAEAAANEYNAQVTETNKGFALTDQARTATQTQGRALAAYGASGVQTDTGSPMDVLADSAGQAAYDRLKLTYNYDSQAQLDRMKADSAKSAAVLNATSTMVQGVGQAYTQGGNKIPLFGSNSGA